MKDRLLALHHWMMTDIHGNVPANPMSGNLQLEPWQLQLFAGMMLGIALFVYMALAASGVIAWLPF